MKIRKLYLKINLSYLFITIIFVINIGHHAAIYIEEYSLSSGLRANDAIIAATATENNMELSTGNIKHFKLIKDFKSIRNIK